MSGKFIRDETAKIYSTLENTKGKEACTEPDYLKWMPDGDFAVDTKMIAKRSYKK